MSKVSILKSWKPQKAKQTAVSEIEHSLNTTSSMPIYFGARYLDPRTSRWLSVDPAMYQGDYIPGAPINDEVRRNNNNLPGMGGIYNYVNMHVYHYGGNNPVKYVDPDGRFLGLISRAKDFNTIMSSNTQRGRNAIDVLRITVNNEINNARSNITRLHSIRNAVDTLNLIESDEYNNYVESEVARFIAFTEVRGIDLLVNQAASQVLVQAENRYREVRVENISRGRNQITASRIAENEANKVIDDFIRRYNSNYIPPEPLATD